MNFGDILDQWETQSKSQKTQQNKSTGQEWRNKKKNPQNESIKSLKTNDEQNPKDQTQLSTNNKKINPMDLWLHRYGVVDKDAINAKLKEAEKNLDRATLRKKASDATIDLHGLTRDEAWSRLDNFVTECVRRKLQKILIIHGKGNHSNDNPVLTNMVRTFIEKDYRLGESGHPEKKDGGKGATWVIIRQ